MRKYGRSLIWLVLAILISVAVAPVWPSQAQAPVLRLPFRPGTRWIITQGYNTSTHGGNARCPITVGGTLVMDESGGLNRYALDFASANRTQDQTVLAAADGTVWRRNNGMGAILLKHGDTGYYTTYLHMGNIRVTPGEKVSQGTPLGTVGSVGIASGAHLHFSLIRRTSTAPYDVVNTSNAPFPKGLQDWEPVPLSFVEAQFAVQGNQCNQHQGTTVDVPTTPIAIASSATVLLIDISGSMGDTWRGGVKIESAKRAATDVINMIEQESQIGESNHQVAVATFTTGAYLDLGLTTDYDVARRVVDGLTPLDRTNIGAGLQTANQALLSAPDGAQKIIILLSDGLTNEGLSPPEILAGPVQEAAAAGTCIYTVGFGEPGELDEELLRDIAAGAACGEYNYASAPGELERVYIRLRHQSLGTVLAEFEGQIAQGETVDVGQVEVPRNQGEMFVTLHWPGSDLDLIVTDPRGRPLDENYPGVSLVKYERLVYLIIQNPLPGTWLLQVFGADIPEGILRYDAIVSVRERVGPPPVNSGVILLFVGLAALVGLAVVLIATQQRRQPRLAAASVQVVSGQAMRPFATFRRGRLTIGRDPRCEMVLADPQVSARHTLIQRTPQGYVLTDLNSKNGTFVNDQRVQQVLLRGGERLRIGQTELVFTGAGMPGVSAPMPQPSVGAAMAYLVVIAAGDQEFARYPVVPGTVLGRYAGCPVDLSADALVSRRHARLDCQAGQWMITDLGSGNGTFVNGYPVTSHALRHGDEVRVGNTRMRFYMQ